jgi:4-oxalocrotonate tautomerase
MPTIYVHAFEGRTLEQKRNMVREVTDAVVRTFDVPADSVTIEIVETSREAMSRGGVLFSEMAKKPAT